MDDCNRNVTDWELCVICQESNKEGLQCPADSRRADKGAGYKTLADNLKQFADLGYMPKDVNLSRLDEGDGIAAAFFKHRARYHKSCYALFNSTKLKRAQKRKSEAPDEPPAGGKFTRSNALAYTKDTSPSCFLCESDKQPLHRVSTLSLDARVRECANILNDEKLLAKLGGEDLIALEASYHASCLSMLYRSTEYAKRDSVRGDEKPHRLEGIALADLVTFIEESRTNSGGELPTFKLADLAKMYTNRLQQLGMENTARPNSSRLKERIIAQVPDLQPYNKGRDVYLAFGEDVGNALHKVHKEDSDDEAIHLAKAAAIVRKDILTNKYSFNGSFERDCQLRSIPASLLSFVNMILYGPNINAEEGSFSKGQAALTIAQLVQYNTYLRRREGDVKKERRNKSRESPVPIYVGVSVHAKTRCRDLVEILHKLGISISYDRVLSISTDLGNEVCRRYWQEGAVCPSNLRLGLFTTAAVDNIDHNPSSTTSKDSFHGTGISLFQHPSTVTPGTEQAPINIATNADSEKSIKELPASYTEVIPVQETTSKAQPPANVSEMKSDESSFNRGFEDESTWLEKASTIVVNQESLEEKTQVSWAAFHSHQPYCVPPSSVAVSALLPLFPDQAKSVAMIRHAMNVIKLSVDHLNPGQVPVIAVDQPLYAVAKEIQWRWASHYGEDKFVVVFGGLHIEMAFLKVLGDWLEGSGWTVVLSDANVATPGTANSFLKATNVTRTRRAHQVTACSLFILLKRAYQR